MNVNRIDPETMTAKPLPFFKRTLNAIAKELYLENGWRMPDGFRDAKLRDPRSFTIDEWQQAKRAGLDAREVKATIQECWAVSDNGPAFVKALEERGLFLAQGDRRGHVAVSIEGEVFAISRMIGRKSKEVAARLGDPKRFRSVADSVRHIGEAVAPRLLRYISEAKRITHIAMKPLNERRTPTRKSGSCSPKSSVSGILPNSKRVPRGSHGRKRCLGNYDRTLFQGSEKERNGSLLRATT
jgi:hypothetical protein